MKRTRFPFVVTRPAPDHRKLMATLSKIGARAIHCPAFEIEHPADMQLGERIERLGKFDLVIVTSPVGARTLAAHSAEQPGIHGPRYFAPGQGTAYALASAGLPVGFPSTGGTSEDILAMGEFADVDGLAIAIVGAPGGRGLLEQSLSERGARVERVNIYRRKKLPPSRALIDALEQRYEPVVLITSLQAFDLITSSLPDRLKPSWLAARFVVSSRRLEGASRDAGVRRIQRAAAASDKEMLAAAFAAGWLPAAAD